MTRRFRLATTAALALAAGTAAAEPTLRPDQAAFRALYQELVETDSSVTTGSCTALADKIETHLRAAGYGDKDITRFAVPGHEREGGIVVVLPGQSTTLKPLLLLGHLDVVVAKREDWTRNPYQLIEENGYFYGRGTADMKAMDAIWIDLMVRYKRDHVRLGRTLKLALTCGEETTTAFNGARWLAENRRELIDAEFALNEGGGGRTDGKGTVIQQNFHVGEKVVANFRLEATNPGGHSSIPVRENAIYDLADALVRIRDFEFPVQLNDTTRAYFAGLGASRSDLTGAAMRTLVAEPLGSPASRTAAAVLDTDRSFHSMLRTTCVATLLDGGHANNALPQRAGANINCRIFPGVTFAEVQDTLTRVIANPHLTLVKTDDRGPLPVPPRLTPAVLAPAQKLVAKYYPGVPLVPVMSTGATDGIYLEAAGIPSYGPPGLYGDPDGMGVHGLNEHAIVKAVYTGRDFLGELVRAYAQ